MPKSNHIALQILLALVALQLNQQPLFAETETVQVCGDHFEVEWLTTETFTAGDWRSNWAFEGDSQIKTEDGWLAVGKADDAHKNVFTGWLRQELPQNVFIRMQAKARHGGTQNACNLNLFLHARESGGGPLEFNRSGDYPSYHTIPNYIVTFTGGIQPGWSRVRLNPGFHLLSDVPERRSEAGETYELTLALLDDRLRFYINGDKVHDVSGFEPLPGGYFGLRTWNSYVAWRIVEIGALRKTRTVE